MKATPGLLAVALVVALPLAALAGPQQTAKQHVQKAMKAHEDGKFEVALTELQTAYKLDPQIELLFAIGQIYVKLGRCDDAKASYDKFLAKTKDPQAKPVVAQALAACTNAAVPVPEPKPEPEPAVPPAVVEPKPAPEPAPSTPPEPVRADSPFADRGARAQSPEGSPWYKDPIGDALVAGGVVALVVGGVIYMGARGELDDAESANTLAEYDDRVDSAQSKRTTSVVLIGGGVALVAAGVARYMLRDNKQAARVGMVPASGGGVITWTGGF